MPSIYPRNVPVPVECHGATVQNAGPGDVYYADNPDVSSQSFEGSLAAGASAVLSDVQWFMAPSAKANLSVGAVPVPGSPIVVPYSLPGTLEVIAGALPFVVPVGGVLRGVIASARVAPTGQAAVFDLNKNGTTVFITQGNRPTIPKDGYVGTLAVPDATHLEVGDTLTIDVDAIGFTPDPVPVAYVGTDVGSSAFNTVTYNVTRPAGIQSGDHMILVMRARGGGDWSAQAGAGWIKHTAGVGVSDTGSFVFSRRDDGSTGPWVFRGTVQASSVVSARIWYRNVYTVSPVDVIATSKGTGTSHTLPSTDTSVIDTKVLAISSVDQNKTATLPSGHTARAGYDGTTVLQCHFADKVVASAGAMGTEAVTVGGGGAIAADVHLALRRVPDPAVPSPGEDVVVNVRYVELS